MTYESNATYPAISRNYLEETQLLSYPIRMRTDRTVAHDYYNM